jgi:hypothetical protein
MIIGLWVEESRVGRGGGKKKEVSMQKGEGKGAYMPPAHAYNPNFIPPHQSSLLSLLSLPK